MSKIDTPLKQDIVNPNSRRKPKLKTEQPQPKLVSHSESESKELPFVDDQYDVIGLIGSGGMGTVYKVVEKETGNVFAIKLIRTDLTHDQSLLKRFELEVEATMGLTHPNLVPTLAQGTTPNGAPYLVMEYVEGLDLATVIKNEGRLNSDRVLNIVQQVCDALIYAHDLGIIHRDIKPTNIILTKNEDGIETARLVDFGIAKLLSTQNRETHDLTETGAVFGNPYYMSPEHCLSLKMDARSDIYSIGCLIYELCTGSPPFAEANPVQVIVKHIHDEAPAFRAEYKADEISDKLSSVSLRCLEKSPEIRYQSVAELSADLDLVRNGKRPAKYTKKKNSKPEFTKAQIIAAVMAIVLVIQSRALTGGWSDHILLVAILSGAGALAFSYLSFKQLWKLFKGNVSSRRFWTSALFVSLATISWLQLPDNLYLLYAENMSWMAPCTQIVALLVNLALVAAVVAVVGCALFRSTIKTAFWKISLQYFAVVLGVVLISSAVLPKWTSEELAHCCLLGNSIEERAPWLTDSVLRYALMLDPSNKSAVYRLASSLHKQKKISEAVATIDSYVADKSDTEILASAYFAKSNIHKDQSSDAQIQDLNNAIKLLPSKVYYEALGDALRESGRYEKALEAYDDAMRMQPGAASPYCGKALVSAIQGDHETAAKQLESMTKTEDTVVSVFVLRGLLRNKLHDEVGAKEDFQRVIQFDVNPNKSSQQGMTICEIMIRIAYGYKLMGDNAKFATKMEEAQRYSYGQFERSKMEFENMCKSAGLTL